MSHHNAHDRPHVGEPRGLVQRNRSRSLIQGSFPTGSNLQLARSPRRSLWELVRFLYIKNEFFDI